MKSVQIHIGSEPWTIEFRSEKSHKKLLDLEGYCELDDRKIYINTKYKNYQSTLLHEIMHAVLWQFRLTEAFCKAYGIPTEAEEEAQELFILPFAQVLFDTLKSNGFLNLNVCDP